MCKHDVISKTAESNNLLRHHQQQTGQRVSVWRSGSIVGRMNEVTVSSPVSTDFGRVHYLGM